MLEYLAMLFKRIPALLILLAAVGLAAKPAQEAKTVWGGVYTEAQAAQGRAHYEENCSSCHAPDLSGRVGGSLKGDNFIRDWSGKTLGTFFERIKTTMPRGAAGSLSESAYLDIVAYVLQVNGFPANAAAELKTDTLQIIQVESKEGPGFIPNSALVEAVGCLAQGPDKVWTLVDATDVVRALEVGAPNAETLSAAAQKELGKGELRLLYVFPAPDAFKGHKVHSKGLLIRDPNGLSINVTSLRTLAATCK